MRYLTTAHERLGRDDLAVVSHHMGIGNLSSVLRAYVGDGRSERGFMEAAGSKAAKIRVTEPLSGGLASLLRPIDCGA